MRLQQLMEQHSKAELFQELLMLLQSRTSGVLEGIPENDREGALAQAVRLVNDGGLAEGFRQFDTLMSNLNNRMLLAAVQMIPEHDAVDPTIKKARDALQQLSEVANIRDRITSVKALASRIEVYRDFVVGDEEWPNAYTPVMRAAARSTLRQIGVIL